MCLQERTWLSADTEEEVWKEAKAFLTSREICITSHWRSPTAYPTEETELGAGRGELLGDSPETSSCCILFPLEHLVCPVAAEVHLGCQRHSLCFLSWGSCQNGMPLARGDTTGFRQSAEGFRRVTTCCGFSWLLIE